MFAVQKKSGMQLTSKDREAPKAHLNQIRAFRIWDEIEKTTRGASLLALLDQNAISQPHNFCFRWSNGKLNFCFPKWNKSYLKPNTPFYCKACSTLPLIAKTHLIFRAATLILKNAFAKDVEFPKSVFLICSRLPSGFHLFRSRPTATLKLHISAGAGSMPFPGLQASKACPKGPDLGRCAELGIRGGVTVGWLVKDSRWLG